MVALAEKNNCHFQFCAGPFGMVWGIPADSCIAPNEGSPEDKPIPGEPIITLFSVPAGLTIPAARLFDRINRKIIIAAALIFMPWRYCGLAAVLLNEGHIR